MSTLVAKPVVVELPRILTSEGPSPSTTISSSRPGAAAAAPRIPSTDGSQPEPARPPRYSPPQVLQPVQPPPQRPGLGYSSPHTTSHGYYPTTMSHFPPIVSTSSGLLPMKRSPPSDFTESAPKKQSKWTEDEDDTLITLRGENMKWEEIAKHVPGRSAIACRLHYQNFLERRATWDEEKKNKLAQLYNRLKGEIWDKIARELHMPWRAVEDMHWRMGRAELAQRAGVREFVAQSDSLPTGGPPTTGIPITTSFIPPATYPAAQMYGSPQETLVPALGRAPGQMSPMPQAALPPVTQHQIPSYATSQPALQFVDPSRPPPAFNSSQRSPTHYSHPSPNSHGSSSPKNPEHHPRRSGSDVGSPRRRAISSSRHVSTSMPPLDTRRPPASPPSLPPLPRDIQGPTSDPSQGIPLPPVRLLQEEVREASRVPTPSHTGNTYAGSGPSRPRSTTSGGRSNGDPRIDATGNGR